MNKWRKPTRLEGLTISHFLNYPILNIRVIVHSILDNGNILLANIEIVKFLSDSRVLYQFKRIIL